MSDVAWKGVFAYPNLQRGDSCTWLRFAKQLQQPCCTASPMFQSMYQTVQRFGSNRFPSLTLIQQKEKVLFRCRPHITLNVVATPLCCRAGAMIGRPTLFLVWSWAWFPQMFFSCILIFKFKFIRFASSRLIYRKDLRHYLKVHMS